jgi:hypothetical protein
VTFRNLIVVCAVALAGGAAWAGNFPLGHERPVSPISSGPAFGTRGPSAAASDGDHSLVVWQDGRSEAAIYGVIIDHNGNPIAPNFRIGECTPGEDQQPVAAAWNGDHYLVVWTGSRDTAGRKLVASRLSRDGVIQDAIPFILGRLDTSHVDLVIAGHGEAFLVSARGSGFTALVKGDSIVKLLATRELKDIEPDDGGFLSVTDDGEVFHFDEDGNVSVRGVLDFGSGSYPRDLHLTQVTGGHWISWIDNAPGKGIMASFLPEGAGSIRVPKQITQTGYWIDSIGTAPEADGGLYVAWVGADEPTIFNTVLGNVALDRDGLVHAGVTRAGDFQSPTPIVLGDSTVTVLTRNQEIESWKGGQSHLLSTSAPAQSEATGVAVNGTVHLFWLESRGEISSIVYAPLSSSGDYLRSPFDVAPDGEDQSSPASASNGTSVLVTWFEDFTLLAALFDLNGNLIAGPIRLASPVHREYQGRPVSVTWSGAWYLVAYSSSEPSHDIGLRVSRISPAGALIDPEGLLVPTISRSAYQLQISPSFATTGQGLTLLVWQDGAEGACQVTCPPPPAPARVLAARLHPGGGLVDPTPISLLPETTLHLSPSTAWDGQTFLVAWVDAHGVQATRVSDSTEPLDLGTDGSALRLGEAGDYPSWISLNASANGRNGFIVSWNQPFIPGVIRLSRIDHRGTVLDPGGIDVCSGCVQPDDVTTISIPGAAPLLVYSRLDPAAEGVRRLFVRPLVAEPRKHPLQRR